MHNRMPRHRNPSPQRQQRLKRQQHRPLPAVAADSVADWARAVEPDAAWAADRVVAWAADKAVDADVAPVVAADAAWAADKVADAGLVAADVAGVDFLPPDGYAYDLF